MSSSIANRALPPLPPGERPPPIERQIPMVEQYVDFLLPTGILISIQVAQNQTLRQLKDRLFREAKGFPLFSLLKDQGFYNFMGISQDGEKEEYVNETRELGDLDLFAPVLKLVERQGNQQEKLLTAEISNLIGRRLHDFDIMGAEVQDFRRNCLSMCESAVNERNANDRAAVLYNHPPTLLASGDDEIDGIELIEVDIFYSPQDSNRIKVPLKVDLGSGPSEVVERAMFSDQLNHILGRSSPDEWVLKVVGREEYLLKEKRFSSYKYVRDSIAKEKRAQFSLKRFQELIPEEKDKFIPPVFSQIKTKSKSIRGNPKDCIATWDIMDTYKVKVVSAKNVNVAENQKVYVRAGIYHGSEPVCSSVTTSQGASSDGAEWNEILEFNAPIGELPRAAKLCFVIFGATESVMKKGGRKRKQLCHVAWVNVTVFDYAGMLQTGTLSLYAWPIDTELEEVVHYMGSTVLNPSTTECVCLNIDIMMPNLPTTVRHPKPIVYPSMERIRTMNQEVSQTAIPAHKFPPKMIKDLQKVVEQDPLAQLDEQDKEMIWKMRSACQRHFPQSLPKMLQSVAWNNRSDVAQMYVLLEEWQQLTPEVAMELLDYAYADIKVRNFAVECLEVLSDDMLLMYLLQLVQVLKFEVYLDCPLGRFLLRRALRNKTIGHFLFWHLRSEMHLPTVSVRFGLMLEAYCRGCGSYMKELSVQLTALTKMKQLTDLLQTMAKKKTDDLLKCLHEPHFVSAMEDLSSPLDPSLRCKALKVDKCKIMDSKMRPLWVVFENDDALGDDILHIFKNGDDLRQDMLTLQIMTIMDTIWKSVGLDLRMNPYGCLSTGDQVGMIDIVLSAQTIAKVQKKKGAKGAFDKKLLYQWLKEQNPDPVALDKAVENFTYSCAGCCVATYVLGIGDRHSDNIMIRKNGQLVHIDFGHFLGNFKSKFGVKRERVPFVLTDDFIYIVTQGGAKDSKEFGKFKKLCEEAFLKLRDHGPLFLNLFTMMLSCGIPELRTRDDISYIRDALCLGEPREVALENFRKKLAESIRNSWSVSLNWYIHNVARSSN